MDRTHGWSEETLHAYHDGELGGLARWRFERALRRDPALRQELDQLSELGAMLRELDARESAPDLWEAIEGQLPSADARRAARRAAELPRGASLIWWLKPLSAVAATAAIAALLLYGGLFQESPADAGGVVRWIDTGDRGVMVLDDDPETTIIWILDGKIDGAWIGGRRDVV